MVTRYLYNYEDKMKCISEGLSARSGRANLWVLYKWLLFFYYYYYYPCYFILLLHVTKPDGESYLILIMDNKEKKKKWSITEKFNLSKILQLKIIDILYHIIINYLKVNVF